MILAAPLVALLAAAGAHPAFASRLREPAPDARVAPGVVAADVAVARASAPPAPLQDDALSDGSRISDVRDDVLASDAPIAPAAGVGAAPQKGVRGSAAAAEDGLLRDRGVDVEEAVSAEEGLSWGGRPSECAKHVNGWTYFSSDRCKTGTHFHVYTGGSSPNDVKTLYKPQALTKVKDQASKGDLDWSCSLEAWDSQGYGDVSIGSTEKGKNIAASFFKNGRVCWYYGTGGAGEEAYYRVNLQEYNNWVQLQSTLMPPNQKTYVLDNSGGRCTVGNPVHLWEKVAGHINQQWFLDSDGRIKPKKCPGLYLEYTGDDCAASKLVLGNGNKNPGWTYEAISYVNHQLQYQVVFIKNKCSSRDMVIDVGGGATKNGQDIYLYPKHGGSNQQWYGVYKL